MARTFDRDRLETAMLLRLELDGPEVVRALIADYGIDRGEAIELAAAAAVCERKGIEP
jgi:hypothetical protein